MVPALTFGERLRQQRKLNGLTVDELALWMGCDRGTIYIWMGGMPPKAASLIELDIISGQRSCMILDSHHPMLGSAMADLGTALRKNGK